MKIVIISKLGNMSVILAQSVPRIGEQVGLFYEPNPRVTDVVWWPGSEILCSLGVSQESEIEALVLVG